MPTFIRSGVRRARKTHQCEMCLATIEPGDHHYVQTNQHDGRVYDWRNCQPCERDRVANYAVDWTSRDEGVTYESAAEWAPEIVGRSKDPCERRAARNWLARICGSEGE